MPEPLPSIPDRRDYYSLSSAGRFLWQTNYPRHLTGRAAHLQARPHFLMTLSKATGRSK